MNYKINSGPVMKGVVTEGDTVELINQTVPVITTDDSKLAVNIDPESLAKGDMTYLRKLGLTITNPETSNNLSIHTDHAKESWGEKVHDFFSSDDTEENDDSDESDNDDDSDYFHTSSGVFGGSSSFGGFGGSSFGGFGGGGFSGGGASASF